MVKMGQNRRSAYSQCHELSVSPTSIFLRRVNYYRRVMLVPISKTLNPPLNMNLAMEILFPDNHVIELIRRWRHEKHMFNRKNWTFFK